MNINIKRKEGKNPILLQEKGGLPYFQFQKIVNTNKVKHMFTTRLGGVSQGACSTLNLSFTRGDDAAAVEENFKRVAKVMGTEYEDFVFSDQTHTTNLYVVTDKDRGKGLTKKRDYSDIDGLLTNVKGIVLSTFYADCVPLYFVDPVKEAIALVHSGWRGTVGKIGKLAVEKMYEEYGSNPKDIIGAIGPSICQECYEVDKDVIIQFQSNFPKEQWSDFFCQKENGKYQLNLWKANEFIMEEAGLKKENIEVTDVCTCCNPELLFSHRASQGRRGNLAAFLALK
ncbi:peptidoglycan editing factor PgeF [Anaerosacchariphilus polymeriproducens]|uniref:Purine nucleoside phosphorylase n=1 Tax=Anaerosacchariphilus polymeriproducens TaxID=1812858 RepID=A0A371ATM5_9FIRM|nr:peptidoglycan editing factor PgeF [Anaerosacchariphilus polymeriproducens]RDU22934.1 peptidoglycan editing factor PgeF [Anaerosacchariphilus polymeriproducens]